MGAFNWPFADGFDDRIGADPSPPDWVRDWRWLLANVGEPAQSYVGQVTDRGIGPVFGRNLCSARDVELNKVPETLVRSEFATQEIVISYGGMKYRLVAVGDPVAGPCPITADVGFVSLTRRIAGTASSDVRWSVPEGWQVVAALAADRRWTDQMTAATPHAICQRARETDQPYYVQWQPGPGHGRLDVVAATSGEVVDSSPACLTRAVLTCPLIPDAQCGQLCRMHGGPWVSSSINAAAHWSANRANRLADVGCDTCGNGAVVAGPMSDGLPRIYAGTRAPGVIDIRTEQHIRPRPGGQRWSQWLSDNRYGQIVILDR